MRLVSNRKARAIAQAHESFLKGDLVPAVNAVHERVKVIEAFLATSTCWQRLKWLIRGTP